MGWVVNATLRPRYPGEVTQYLLYRNLGGPQGQSKRVPKISPPPGFDLRTVQSIVSCYTDCAIPAPFKRGVLTFSVQWNLLRVCWNLWTPSRRYYMIYLLTVIGLSPGGITKVEYSTIKYSTVHIYTQTVHKTNNTQYDTKILKSAGRAQSWQVMPWNLPYSCLKSTDIPQSW